MAREIYVPLGDTGNANLYVRRRNEAGQYWRGDTSAYEAYNAANIALYGADAGSATPYNALTEDGDTGDYFGDDPTTGTGTWTAYEQAGAAPAASDDAVATGDFPQAAAAAAIAAAEPIDANVTQVAGVSAELIASLQQDVRDAMGLTSTSGEDSIDDKIDAIGTGGTGSGKGSNTIQFEITNSSGTLLENATITLRLNDILKATGTTGATGRLTGTGLAVEETATYALSVTCDGYNGHTADLVVTAGVNTMVEVELTALAITPPDNPTDCACAWVCLDDNDDPVAGVIVRARPDTDATGTGYAWSGHTRSATSVVSTGLATINLPQGSKWWIRRDSGIEELFTVPSTTTSVVVVSVRGGKRDTQ